MMLRSGLVAAALTLAPALAHAQEADPFARARDGWVECHDANTVARTCAAFGAYRFAETGEVHNDVVLHVATQPLIIVTSTSTVYARDGMICERLDRAVIDAARITVDGQPAPPAIDQQLKNAVWSVFAGANELCSRVTTNGDVASVTVYLDGVEKPELAAQFTWIRPEGYTLAAAPETSDT